MFRRETRTTTAQVLWLQTKMFPHKYFAQYVAVPSLKNGPFPASFSLFSSFNTQLTVNKCSIPINFWWWLDSNRGPLVSEATALPTEPQPLTWRYFFSSLGAVAKAIYERNWNQISRTVFWNVLYDFKVHLWRSLPTPSISITEIAFKSRLPVKSQRQSSTCKQRLVN